MLKKQLRSSAAMLVLLMTLFYGSLNVFASSDPSFYQAVTSGSAATVDIVDAGYTTVGSPSVTFSSTTASLTNCDTSTGTLGTASEQLLIENGLGTSSTWTVSIAATAPTDVWTSSVPNSIDFNDATGGGCSDGADADSVGGQMTVDPSTGTIGEGQFTEVDTGVSLGASSAFVQGTTNSIVLVSGDTSSAVVGDWTVQGISLSQTIPAGTAADPDFQLNMTITISQV